MKTKRANFDLICAFLSGIILLGMYCFPETLQEAAFKGINLCLKKVIPTILPYIITAKIFSSFLLRFSANKRIRSKLYPDILILLLGIVSGFPNGAILASEFYKNGAISKKRAEILISCSNSISPAFCISVFGSDVLNGSIYGIITLISIITVNFVLYLIQIKGSHDENKGIPINDKKVSSSSVITLAITDGITIMINVCAFVIYFMCIGSVLHTIITYIGLGDTTTTSFVCSLFEIAGGLEIIKNLRYGARFMMGNAVIGFCGISAIMQVLSICSNAKLSAKRFIIAKIVSFLAVPTIAFVIMYFMNENAIRKNNLNLIQVENLLQNRGKMILAIIILITLLTIFVIKLQKELKKSKIIL